VWPAFSIVLSSGATRNRQRFTLAAKQKAGCLGREAETSSSAALFREVNSECFLVQLRNKQQIVLKAAAQ